MNQYRLILVLFAFSFCTKGAQSINVSTSWSNGWRYDQRLISKTISIVFSITSFCEILSISRIPNVYSGQVPLTMHIVMKMFPSLTNWTCPGTLIDRNNNAEKIAWSPGILHARRNTSTSNERTKRYHHCAIDIRRKLINYNFMNKKIDPISVPERNVNFKTKQSCFPYLAKNANANSYNLLIKYLGNLVTQQLQRQAVHLVRNEMIFHNNSSKCRFCDGN